MTIFENNNVPGINIYNYNLNNLNENSEIEIVYESKKIKVSVKDVNWFLTPKEFDQCFTSEYFMFCFRFSVIPNINYLKLDKNIRKNYETLYDKIISSEIMEKVMTIDKEANQFEYPYKNKKIFKEVESNCFLVPFPADKYFGYTDKISFKIYLNCVISPLNIKTVITDIDNIIKSKYHEFKHINRVYYHAYNRNISLWTPRTNSISNSKLLNEKKDFFKKKEDKFNLILENRVITPERIKNLDYGDIVEYGFVGNKQNIFFMLNSLFCLKESSWDLSSEKFDEEYFKSCEKQKFFLKKQQKDAFIYSLFEYFKFEDKIRIVNEANTSKRGTKNQIIEDNNNKCWNNEYVIIEKANHCKIKKYGQ